MQSVFIHSARRLLCVAIAGLLMFGLPAARLAAEETAAAEKSAAVPAPDSLPTLDFVRDSVQLMTHPVEVWALAFSAHDEFLVAAGGAGRNSPGSGLTRVWNFGQTKEIAAYPTPRGDLSAALSPDGRRVAWSSWSGDLWLREVGGPELLHETFQRPARVAFSPDGQMLVAAVENHRLQAWNAATGKPLDGFRGTMFAFYWVGFSPDGKYLVACGGAPSEPDNIQVAAWDVATHDQLYELSDNPQRILFASISPDSKTLATGAGNSIVLRDLASGDRRSQTEESGSPVQRLAFSPDGSLLASAGGDRNDGAVTLWDPSTGKTVGKLTGHERDVRALAFTHDGKTLATGGGDRSIRLWNVGARQQIGVLQESQHLSDPKAETAAILAVAYSPDGNSVATASEDGQVSIYGLAPAGPVRSWPAHADAAAALAYSPDGLTLASGGYDKVIKFWNASTGQQIRSLGGHTGWVVSLAFSHDGQSLASGSYDRSIRLWNVADGTQRHALTGHTAAVRSVAFSHNDKLLASGGADHSVRLWDPAVGQEQAALAGHEGGVRSVAFSPDDRLLASGGEDQAIKLWNVDSHDLAGSLTGHADTVSAVAFAQQTLVSTGWDQRIRTWDVAAREMRGNLATGNPVVALAVAPDGHRLLSAGANQSLSLWKATAVESRPTLVLGDFRAFPWSAAFSPDGKSLAVAAGGTAEETDLYLYDLATDPLAGGAEKYHVTVPGSVRSIAFAPAGDRLALGYPSKQLLLVEAATGREVASLEEQRIEANPAQVNAVRSAEVKFSPDGKLLAAASLDHSVRIYDVERRELVKTLTGHNDSVLSIAFSPNQAEMISGSRDRTAVIWDLAVSERRYSLPLQPGIVESVAWSPAGRMVAIGCETGTCGLWHAATGTPLRTIAAHPVAVNEIRFSPDSKLLATAGADRTVKLWDVSTGERLQTYACHPGPVECVEFAPDGKSFVTTGRGGGAKLWSTPGPESK
jgi:WD40 repeat protein